VRVFDRLRALRTFEKQHLGFLRTIEDHNLVREIGYHQAEGAPLTLKQLFLLDVGSVATVQRRLRRLRHLGIVQQRQSEADRRAIEISLTPKYFKAIERYGSALTGGADGNLHWHLCTLYDSDAGRRALTLDFLVEGLRRGQRCVLVAPPDAQKSILRSVPRGARAQLVVTAGETSVADQVGFLKDVLVDARKTERSTRLVGDVNWALKRGLSVSQILEIERELDALSRHFALQGLCLYDARRFSASAALRALKCHRDTALYPLPLA
jgi:DNA-binding MarR family transcriptional regulator